MVSLPPTATRVPSGLTATDWGTSRGRRHTGVPPGTCQSLTDPRSSSKPLETSRVPPGAKASA